MLFKHEVIYDFFSNYVIYSNEGTKYFYLNYANSSGTWSISSDASLKKDIKQVQSQLSNILALNPVSFRWKSQQETDKESIGFIAQDYQKIYPNDVSFICLVSINLLMFW